MEIWGVRGPPNVLEILHENLLVNPATHEDFGGTLEIPRNFAQIPQNFREILEGIMDFWEIWGGPAADPRNL